MKKILLLGSLLLFGMHLSAQTTIGANYMTELWQSSLLNPARQSEHRLVVVLPSLSNTFSFTGPTYGVAIQDVNGNARLDVDALIANLEDRNELREQLQLGTIGVSLQLGKVQLGLHHAVRFDAWLDYPRELPSLIWKGNAQYIGETIPLDNRLRITGYHEIGLAGSVDLGNVRVGGRVKYLSGIGDITTSRSEASLYTDPEFYQLTFMADYQLQTASSLNYEAYNDFQTDFNFGQLSADRLFSGNAGIGIDLGADIDLGALQLGASVVDLGGITWRDDVRIYSSEGSFTYDGLDISQALTGDSVSLEQALDTLAVIFDLQETSDSYRTQLPTTIFLTAGYQLSNTWELGAVLSGAFFREEFEPGAAVFARAEIAPWLRLGGSYAVARNTFTNIGLSGVVRLGPVQIYAMTDNIIGAFQPDDSRFFNIQAGLNLVFGQRNARDQITDTDEPGVRF